MPIYEYPTTIVFVDDDPLFTEMMRKWLGRYKHIKTFASAEQALDFFMSKDQGKILNPNHFLKGLKEDESYACADHSPVDLNITDIIQLRNSADKAQEVSVLISDFKMYNMNGLELCQRLQAFPMKKILLSSETNLNPIVEAFNQDLIDRFIPKDKDMLVRTLNQELDTLVRQYFIEKTQALLAHLEADHPLPLSDKYFVNFFNNWLHEHKIKEFYLIDKQGSLLMVDEAENLYYFIIHTDASLASLMELYEESVEEYQFMETVKNREKIPFFGIGKEAWQLDIKEWSDYLYPAQQFMGKHRYYWAFL